MPFNVKGGWEIVQSSGHVVSMDVRSQQSGGRFDIGYNTAREVHSGNGRINDAWTSDSECVFLIVWDNGARGRYSGRFDFQGRLTGMCHDEAHPSAVASWYAKKPPDDVFKQF
ncbi:hypothetical protein [Streptomyces sp. NPDC057253]|uniref:hypothetical protein n=1 Tax=Streptomyces sp. NPDC057253 TaxID=3346069 RepID=UPI00363B6FB8